MATKKTAKKTTKKSAAKSGTALLIATRKGAFIMRGDASRKRWSLEGPHFLGSNVFHVIVDPNAKKTLILAMKDGHLGPTVQRSIDGGKSWTESSKPPRFRKSDDPNAKSVTSVFWLSPGHASEPNVFYAGTTPYGLFRSSDGGATWDEVTGFRDTILSLAKLHPDYFTEVPGDGPMTHSIRVDPADASHLYTCISGGGVFESRDRGDTWKPLNRGLEADFLPPGEHDYGHDPHCLVVHPNEPNRLWQQNHCGIYKMDRGDGERWERVGRAMPKDVGDIGFGIVTHPKHADSAWVFPMDGTAVWPRTSPGGKPAVYRTKDAGRTWKRLDKGLPRAQGWFTVYRQGFCRDDREPLGLYFGTSCGEVWASTNEGARWTQIAHHLPQIQAVEAVSI